MTHPILSRGEGRILGQEYLACDPGEVLWGWLPGAMDRPLLSVRPGTTVTIDTLSHEGILEDQGRDPLAFFSRFGVPRDHILDEAIDLARSGRPRDPNLDGPHVVTGPIGVVGAVPGDLVSLTVEEVARRVPYGVVSNRHGRGALAYELPEYERVVSTFASVHTGPDGSALGSLPLRADGSGCVSFPLSPFPGILGVATTGRRAHSVPPGPHGGNLDINLLTAGSILYLPVQVPEALVYVGDPHFAQGDGEVALTAMEASLRVTLRIDVLSAGDARILFGDVIAPVAETAEFLVPTGLDTDLDVAVQNCVRAALGLLQHRYGMDRSTAYAYLSAATDFNISQVVDLVKGVHARIRKSDFDRAEPLRTVVE